MIIASSPTTSSPSGALTAGVLGVIPARLSSQRLPDKPLHVLAGRPLVEWVWRRVVDFRLFDQIVVATDSARVADVARSFGARCVMTREDHPSGTDRVAEVARLPEYAGYATIVNVQGDEPFVRRDHLEGAVGIVTSGLTPIGTAAVPVSTSALHDPACVKVVCDDAGRAMYFSRAPIPWLRDEVDAEVLPTLVRQHLGIYAYTRDALQSWVALPVHPLERIERLEQLRPLAAGLAIGVAIAAPVIMGGIDTEEDLVRANAHWNSIFAVRSPA